MQHIEKCTYVYVVHVFEVDYICRPQIPQVKVSWISFHNENTVSMLIAWQMKFDAPAENKHAILGPVYMEVGNPR